MVVFTTQALVQKYYYWKNLILKVLCLVVTDHLSINYVHWLSAAVPTTSNWSDSSEWTTQLTFNLGSSGLAAEYPLSEPETQL